jgi:HD-like signal output (HDOD) protein
MHVRTLTERPGSTYLRDWLKATDFSIPVLPAIAARVIEVASDPEVPVSQLARIVSKDQVLATRVLGFANSAYSAPMQEIDSVTDAIVRMGTAAVRNVVVTVCFASRMHDPKVYGEHGAALVDHGIGTAYLSRLVAERAGVPEEEAFL